MVVSICWTFEAIAPALWVLRLDAITSASILSNMDCALGSACGSPHISRRLDCCPDEVGRREIHAGPRRPVCVEALKGVDPEMLLILFLSKPEKLFKETLAPI